MTDGPGFGNTLVYLSLLIQRRYAQICADHDLTTAQAQLLCTVKDQPRGMGELSQLLGLAKPGLSGLVDRTERRGLVQRVASDRDRRACTVISTPLGKEVGNALYADVAARLPDIFGHLPAADRRVLEELVAGVPTDCGD
ncbi:MarR family winged helix-turn-helix transcriptional regulator [Actinoplanes sp. NEAU-A12]|uniref:MarR family winged helix-turn-helix transcriptional regulator n=1 Tax=Actinoplanes sandaracinus TaxID=3045177 RepID=A0ABT6WKG9_9ACTN|nr:MarR family winged helix-turn-helix transcriptional regulator [Actinoplanes sandaracinus]MDI6100221.1 MarR family winged helix-turn-helix transcriptional regulator [Actinoplanes sandaracinus]